MTERRCPTRGGRRLGWRPCRCEAARLRQPVQQLVMQAPQRARARARFLRHCRLPRARRRARAPDAAAAARGALRALLRGVCARGHRPRGLRAVPVHRGHDALQQVLGGVRGRELAAVAVEDAERRERRLRRACGGAGPGAVGWAHAWARCDHPGQPADMRLQVQTSC